MKTVAFEIAEQLGWSAPRMHSNSRGDTWGGAIDIPTELEEATNL